MSDTTALDPIISRIRKLLALSRDAGATEAEAAVAAAKVQELLLTHNLEMAALDQAPSSDRAKEAHTKAAMYKYQQDLMAALAANNFCRHWINEERVHSNGKIRNAKRHYLLGRRVNIMTTQMTYDYLVDTMDRLLPWQGMEKRGKNALAWLAGCTSRLVERLNDQRQRERTQARQQRAAQPAGTPGTALTVLDLESSEEDLNNDFRWGYEPGTTARQRHEAAARETAYKLREAELIAQGMDRETAYYVARYGKVPDWAQPAAPKPETAAERARREAKEERERERWRQGYYRRAYREAARKADPAYQAGRAAGDDIGLNAQVGRTERQRIR